MPKNKTRLILADDHQVIRQGIRGVLQSTDDFEVVAEAGTLTELRKCVLSEAFDMIVLDISFKDENGIDMLKWLKVECPGQPVVIFSMYPEDLYATRALKAGARGYVSKDGDPDLLIRALRKVREGDIYVSDFLAKQLAGKISDGNYKAGHHALSNRETQVLCMLAAGKSVKEISDGLGISETAVYTYKRRIFSKLEFQNDAQMVRYAVENEMVP